VRKITAELLPVLEEVERRASTERTQFEAAFADITDADLDALFND